jgi:ring-1,2-phenylacetyl-CoA epoxidase subunit PaaC
MTDTALLSQAESAATAHLKAQAAIELIANTPLQPVVALALHLADTALIQAQRNAEWCGHGPVIEEDIALTNLSLDLLGQARLLYQLAAERIGHGCTEDALAYWRDAAQFTNLTLVELPHSTPLVPSAAADRDYAVTIARNHLLAHHMAQRWAALLECADAGLAAVAERAIKENRYHLRHSRDWLLRLGDGTAQSHARMQAALNHLWPYTQEFWLDDAAQCQALGVASSDTWRAAWHQAVAADVQAATLTVPTDGGAVSRGRHGLHSEHLSRLVAEMQSLARAHPGAQW